MYTAYMCVSVCEHFQGVWNPLQNQIIYHYLLILSSSLAIFHLDNIDCNPSVPPLNIACGVWPQSQRQSDVENAQMNEKPTLLRQQHWRGN